MIYVISKSTCGSYNVRDIQCNANWDCCPYSDYALIPDNLVDGILETKGYCDITLNSTGTEVTAFTARTIPYVPEECHAEDQAATLPKTASGSHIFVKNSGDAHLLGLKVYGKTTQKNYSGKNLLPYPYELLHETLHDVTFTDNGDGTITANGTATADVNFLLTPYTARLSLEPGAYVLSGCPAGGGGASYSLEVYGSALEDNTTRSDEGNGVTFTVADNSSTISVSIRLVYNKTYNNLTFKPMIRKASVTDGTWEPYTGGIASPNPNYPQPLESVGDSGSVAVTVAGKNLFGGDALADKLVEVASATKDKTAGTVTYTPANVNTKVIFSFENLNPNARYTIILFGSNSVDKAVQTNIGIKYTDGSSTTISFKAGSNYAIFTTASGKTPRVMHGAWLRGNVTLYYDKCGIFEGVLTEADLEAYISTQTLTIQTPNGLPGINEIVRDCKDYGRGTQTQMVGKIDSYAGEEITGAYISSTGELSNGATVLYELPEPIVTPIPAEELAQYDVLHTNKPNTTVFNDAGAEMEVRYCTPNTAVIMSTGVKDAMLTTDDHGCVSLVRIPEMQFGVEYRTWEKNEGKTVYCRRMNLGAVTTGGGYFEIDNSWNVLRWDAQCREHALPCQYYDSSANGYVCTLGVGRGRIYFNAGSAFNGYTLFVTLWYVKE